MSDSNDSRPQRTVAQGGTSHRSVRRIGRVLAFAGVVILLTTVLGAALAALFVPTTYTYEARVVVGTRELAAQQVPGYTNATISLAETYARYVTEDPTTDSSQAIVSATMIPETPVIRIQATAPSAEEAESVAQQTTDDLLTEVNDPSVANHVSLGADIAELTSELADLGVQLEALDDDAGEEAVRLETAIRLAELRLDALSTSYRDAYSVELAPTTQLTLVQPAQAVTETVPQPVLVGGVAGALLGGLITLTWFSLRARSPRSA